MSKTIFLNQNWIFSKEGYDEPVTLPHTWNAIDGQDGGNDYYRGTCCYTTVLPDIVLPENGRAVLQFDAVAMTAEVYLNEQKLAEHKGGYSAFCVDITDALRNGSNLLRVNVDNSDNDTVYPQKADFTFYGGIYRDVTLHVVPAAHFALAENGAVPVKVTPAVTDLDERRCEVTVEAFVVGAQSVNFTLDGQQTSAAVKDGTARAVFTLEHARLWDGLDDPYLYTVTARLDNGETETARFGCRKFEIDPQKGFILNGHPYPLRGVSRHQDRKGAGVAITKEMMEEDMALILEMGANTIRLAHYQHAQAFYDLCDEKGLVIWAEIPYITMHMHNGRANTLTQMEELIVQNYNHPCIAVWGLSNEITAASAVNEELLENHRALNDLAHKLDPTRPTTMANVFMLEITSPILEIPDVNSYNLYFGWYLGELDQNDDFFDTYHAKYPDRCIGFSEYGADANPAYQSARPERGDWSESYQAIYHEHMLKMWSERPYIWAMHVWNGFDFGADGRGEGGKPGQNQKGLVTFDRKTKKDAYFIYKAYLSSDPFVHLCGRRYVHRTESQTEIKVYSNQPRVTLFVDGKEFAAQDGDKIFKFIVPISGTHEIKAVAGSCTDCMTITKADKPDPTYHAEGQVENWFDKPEELMKEGYYSIMDSMETLQKSPAANKLLSSLMVKASNAYGDVAKNVKMPPEMERQMARTSLRSILKQVAKSITPADVQQLNAALNKIKKES